MAAPISGGLERLAEASEADYSFSNSPPAHGQGKNAAAHQRTYQACIPCRRRKVRCDLGSVDNPHDPPCVRCRREAKECFFSATRRKKRKADHDEADEGVDDDVDYEIKNGRKRMRASTATEVEVYPVDDYDADDQPRTPGGGLGRTRPLPRPEPPRPVNYGEEDHKASEQTTAILQAAEVHGGHDALKVLYEAAVRGRANSTTSSGRPAGSLNGLTPSSLPAAASPIVDRPGPTSYSGPPPTSNRDEGLWRTNTVSSAPIDERMSTNPAAVASALKAWSRFRFVRAGWFTAREGIEYIEYFYKHLNPLTPVTLPDFKPYETHNQLLSHEPMLAITMLLIASRHMPLEGPGSQTRPYSIHQKLWGYLQGMIDRVVWGQEQFGGGFCGAGAEPGCDVNPLTRRGLRTLGTVESLMLLTEWHPRAMHFPPDEADEELMIPEEAFSTPDPTADSDVPKGIGGQRMDSWLEPCWRSDRMCWMLLGMAMSLAFEIGVFDTSEWQRHALNVKGGVLSAEDLQTYDRRRGNVRDLLLIYVTQTSGRLGLTSMLPGNYSKPEDSDVYKRQLGQHDSIQETVKHFWLRMAAIMRDGNHKLFANRAFTRDLIKNGNYKAQLELLLPHLRRWRQDFDAHPSIPKYMRHILEIEYEYTRVYINALALQALAERCANEHPLSVLDPPAESLRSAITTNGVRADVSIAPHTLAKWLGGDRIYIREVGDAARNLLKVVVEGLYPDEYLKHAPVRTYFRIISVAIMLLKSFSLGASEAEVSDSLALMDRTVEALRTCIVDDVHVASRFADLLDTLTTNLKPRLVRISHDGRTGKSHRPSGHATPVGMRPPSNSVVNQASEALRHNQTPTALAGHHWNYNNGQNGTMPSSMPSSAGPHTNHLLGIPDETYDLLDNGNNFSLMPPPNFSMQSPTARMHTSMSPANSLNGSYNHRYANSNDLGGGYDGQDWLTLPLDPLLNVAGADVNQTMYGPELGGQDMLELLLGGSHNQQY
ncbi:hypothetical protein K431DRAFT_264000 [Polychaeton citri CBS 116435]|uniref:Zn(2)-C6 fungal-type domain-containing protein n=1 Tax=Polychaeton citri CBS 116435 TaxID=1314669 RepID=A0A9P4UR76_9PEZI|nr:hypothetical protein K431DRAFT_264000 [Polychaeton citri CBS 116435]